jgi:transposase-like protein
MKLKRYPKKQLKKYYAKQMLLEPLASQSEPHKVIRCLACDNAKGLKFKRTYDGQMYYRCPVCGFESEELGLAPHWLK